MFVKKLLIISAFVVGLLLAETVQVLSQVKVTNIVIQPVVDDRITVCYRYTLEKTNYDICRDYPTDLKNYCKPTRYGYKDCKNILVQEMENDIKNFYTSVLPREIGTSKILKDITITSASDASISDMVSKKYDFMTGEFS